jgi:5-methylcytosine-specific restriction protein A
VKTQTPDDLWSAVEHEAALDVYIWMLDQQIAGLPFVKRALIRDLQAGPLATRTRQAIEYRFQNLSSVFIEYSMPYVRGYAPLKNIGPTGRSLIDKMLAQRELSRFVEAHQQKG